MSVRAGKFPVLNRLETSECLTPLHFNFNRDLLKAKTGEQERAEIIRPKSCRHFFMSQINLVEEATIINKAEILLQASKKIFQRINRSYRLTHRTRNKIQQHNCNTSVVICNKAF
jgi:hypothetical protein